MFLFCRFTKLRDGQDGQKSNIMVTKRAEKETRSTEEKMARHISCESRDKLNANSRLRFLEGPGEGLPRDDFYLKLII